MPDPEAWIPEESANPAERLTNALRLLHALHGTPPPTPDQLTGPEGAPAGDLLPGASAGLTSLLMQLAAITAELEQSDEAAGDPAARELLTEVRDGLGQAQRAAMTLLISYRTEDGTAWKGSS